MSKTPDTSIHAPPSPTPTVDYGPQTTEDLAFAEEILDTLEGCFGAHMEDRITALHYVSSMLAARATTAGDEP